MPVDGSAVVTFSCPKFLPSFLPSHLVKRALCMLLAEFDYSMKRTPSIPVINTVKPRRDMWYLKKYGLPFLYWNLMLKGLA